MKQTTTTKAARPGHCYRGPSRRRPPLDVLIEQTRPTFEAFYIEEPKLVFAGGRVSVDPKTGIEAYGPFDLGKTPKKVRVGVIGTGVGIQRVTSYLEKCRSPLAAGFNARGKPLDLMCFPDFPGCSDDASFRCAFTTEQSIQRIIRDDSFVLAVQPATASEKLRNVVELVTKELTILADREPLPDVVVFVMPDVVEKECAAIGAAFRGVKVVLTLGQKFERKLRKEFSKKGQTFLPFSFDVPDEERDGSQGFWNIHHALKAHCMKLNLPTQLLWDSTLTGEGGSQDPASIAWNIFTALYYKAGNRPWHLQSLSESTCYVGVSFFKESPYANADMQTSLAQVFGAGEGLVLKGQKAFVDKKLDAKPHLDEKGAEQLLTQAISLYRGQHGLPPKRVVVHKTSRYWPDELRGFRKALGAVYSYDFLTLEHLDTHFMRMGKAPPLRGTVVLLGDRNYLIYTVGYVPFLREYPGMRIPNPLEVVEHYGDSTAQTVCTEILGLTKLNWNSCAFGSSLPITIRFARDVGKILAELPPGQPPQTKYKFYM